MQNRKLKGAKRATGAAPLALHRGGAVERQQGGAVSAHDRLVAAAGAVRLACDLLVSDPDPVVVARMKAAIDAYAAAFDAWTGSPEAIDHFAALDDADTDDAYPGWRQ